MNIGIIIFSRTGNTLYVAEKILGACLEQGKVVIQRITAENEDPNNKQPLRFTNEPNPNDFDVLILGAPVQGFALSPIMKAYINQMHQITGKIVYCFVTQQFPKPWMGGNQSIRQMLQLCQAKSANVSSIGIVNWSSKSREAQISKLVSRLNRI